MIFFFLESSLLFAIVSKEKPVCHFKQNLWNNQSDSEIACFLFLLAKSFVIKIKNVLVSKGGVAILLLIFFF